MQALSRQGLRKTLALSLIMAVTTGATGAANAEALRDKWCSKVHLRFFVGGAEVSEEHRCGEDRRYRRSNLQHRRRTGERAGCLERVWGNAGGTQRRTYPCELWGLAPRGSTLLCERYTEGPHRDGLATRH